MLPAIADLHVNGVTGDLVDLQLNQEDAIFFDISEGFASLENFVFNTENKTTYREEFE